MFVSPEQRAIPPSFDYEAFSLPTNIRLTFRLNSHGGPEDMPPVREATAEIKKADAFIEEFISNHDDKATVAAIAKGDEKTYMLWRNALTRTNNPLMAYEAKLFAALFATRTPSTTIDVASDTHETVVQDAELQDRYARTIHAARSNAGLLLAAPILREMFGNLRTRDQIILGNIAPELDMLSAHHPKLSLKRKSQPAKVLAYYGTSHRSLVDALNHKNTQSHTEGFSVQEHPSSYIDDLDEEQYALFLRHEPWPDELLILEGGLRYVREAVVAHRAAANRVKNPYSVDIKAARELVRDRKVADDYPRMRSLALDIHAGKVAVPD